MSAITTAAHILSISVALIASGGIATLSLFDVPELQSQPASRSLPMTRWLFSRGSHIFPHAATVSAAGFVYLAYNTVPSGQLTDFAKLALKGGKVSGYLAAAALSFGIAPVTALLMIPTNFALIAKNEELGGARSQESARQGDAKPGKRSALESVKMKGTVEELSDLSNPQERTTEESSEDDDRRVRELLGKFGRLNALRAVLIGAGGVVGLATALAV